MPAASLRASPAPHACGRALLSKLLCRRLTALVEMSEDPLEEVIQLHQEFIRLHQEFIKFHQESLKL